MPGIDPAHQLVTVGHGPNADTVLVNGRVVLRGGSAAMVDEDEIYLKARKSVGQVIARLGLSLPGLWPRLTETAEMAAAL
jgi:hypothetical protein